MAERPELPRPQPFEHLRRQVLTNPQEIAVGSIAGEFTYRDLFDHSKRIAGALRNAGLKPGHIVATDVPPHLQLFFLEALFHEGCIGCTYPGPGVPAERFDRFVTVMPSAGMPAARTIVVDDAFFVAAAQESLAIDPVDYDSYDSVCRLLFSSGTTGAPHAVPFTIGRLEARSRRAAMTWMPLRPFMSIIGPQAVTGILTAYTAVAEGFPYIAPGSTPETLQLLERYGVRSAKASPVQLAELVEHLEGPGATRPEQLQIIESAGSVLPGPLAAAVREMLAPEVRNLYGSSECGTVAVGHGSDRDPFDMGEVLPHAQVQVVDERDAPVTPGTLGRLRWRTTEQADGYYFDDEASQVSFKNGWFYSGDLGRLTQTGHIQLVGRESETINIGGVKLNPTVLDAFLQVQLGLRDAAAFRYESSLGLPLIGVAVVSDGSLDVDALDDAFAHRFGGAHISAVFEVDAIPRNAYGKPLRLELAARFASSSKPDR